MPAYREAAIRMSASPRTNVRRSPPWTLATAALPGRVRHLLGVVNTAAAQHLSGALDLALEDLERQLFKQAERAGSGPQQSDCYAELQYLRQHRADLIPSYLAALEAELAHLRTEPEPAPLPPEPEDPLEYRQLTLVEDTDLDRDIVLREIARREMQRGGTALLLLGQRFGVLAGRPAYDPEQLPIGPFALCRLLRETGDAMHMNPDSQLLLYRMFERQVMSRYGELVDQLNVLLDREAVLPGLVYQAYVPRTPGQNRRGPVTATAPGQRPLTGWHGQGSASGWAGALIAGLAATPSGLADMQMAATSADAAAAAGLSQKDVFDALQGMLASRRQANAADGATRRPAPGQILPLEAVTNALGALQSTAPARLPGKRRRTMEDLHHSMLEQVRRAHGPQAGLAPEHSDTFELLGMLYREVGREVHEGAPAQDLLERLQVPVARAAVQDPSFFVRDQHPARELLNSVAESGASWLDEDDTDPQLVQHLERTVDRVVEEYDGDEAVFERAYREVQEHHRTQARKAELSERRQVEAARGRDRLETAKKRAAAAITSHLGERKPPQFMQALLGQAWADVLTLTALRHGEDSPEWQARDAATARIVEITCTADAPADPALAEQIDTALRQVGYHAEEASAIARRLSRSDDDETTSRTELTAKLKARARLGEGEPAETAVPPPAAAPLSEKEQACYQQLRVLPFGTWFEFVRNQQGDVHRQRLSWYSPVTDNALFVNARGQKLGEHSLDVLARLMARGQARVVTEGNGRLIDRAWHSTLRALRSLAGGRPGAKP